MKTFLPADAEAYKALARKWAATVTVVTARRRPSTVEPEKTELDGFTATAFLMVSLEPPIIALSVGRSSGADLLLQDAEAFAVNLLSADQAELSAAFARSRRERRDIFKRHPWHPDSSGVPLLEGAAGAFSAKLRQIIEAGDHLIILGDVTAVHHGTNAETLLYCNRSYGGFQLAADK
jgi:flavin reductase (DIM6/NTAB) family NADH-FMN oxidoreductase RutF